MRHNIRRVLCDNCQEVIGDYPDDESYQSLAVAVGPVIREIDLCKACHASLVSPVLALLDKVAPPLLPPTGKRSYNRREATRRTVDHPDWQNAMASPRVCHLCNETFETVWHLAWHVRSEKARGSHLDYQETKPKKSTKKKSEER